MSKEDDTKPSKRIEVHLDLEGTKNAPPPAAKIAINKDNETILQLTHRTTQHFFPFILPYAVAIVSDDVDVDDDSKKKKKKKKKREKKNREADGSRTLILRYTDGSIDTFGEQVSGSEICPASVELVLVSGGKKLKSSSFRLLRKRRNALSAFFLGLVALSPTGRRGKDLVAAAHRHRLCRH